MKENKNWTIIKLKEGFDLFYKEHGRYPTAVEVDAYPNLPSSRQIQRAFGGLIQLRRQLGLEEDFTKGKHSSDRARTIGQRAHKIENEVYMYLIDAFGVEFVHREYFFNDNRRNRTDFYIYYKNGNFSVDVFYPRDNRSISGCINSKLNSYKNVTLKYPVIFLMMNESIPDEQVSTLIKNKKNKLMPNQIVMTYKQFKDFCGSKVRIAIG